MKLNFLPTNVCLWLITFLMLGNVVMAQDNVITGQVSEQNGTGLAGVNILIKGTSKGTVTGANGSYKLTAPKDKAVLVFRYVGFTTQEVPVNNRSVVNVTLTEDTRQLEEVLVTTALGIKKDVRTTGVSIQSMEGAAITKAREPNPINGLVGKIAGLTVGASSELLGSPALILRGNTDLLFVIDGAPINSDTWNISPDDIETYTVLKGASASALYGSRGKNGAILITTKRGTKDKRGFSVEVNTSQMMESSFLTIPEVQDLYGPGDHGVYAFGNGRGTGLNDADYDVWGPKFSGQLIPQYDSPVVDGASFTTTFPTGKSFTSNRQPTPFTARGANNLRRFIQTGILSTNNVAISSVGEKYDLRFSVSHNYQKGLVPNTELNSTTLKMTTGYNFSDRLRFEGDVQVNRQYTPNYPDVNYGPNSMIYNIILWGGADWDIDQMKNYWQPGKEGIQQIYAEYTRYNNPWFMAKEWLRGHYKTDIIGQTSLRYKIATGIDATIRTQFSTWGMLRNEKLPYSMTTYGREEGRGDYREDRRNLFDSNTDLLIKVNKNITPDLVVNGVAGGNIRVFNYNSNYTSTDYLNVPGVYNFANSANPVKVSNFLSDMQVYSAYYSADFTYKNFLTLSTTGRMDKLSTLPKGNNTYFYPSVAVSTVISDYVTLPDAISFLKVRGSYANVKDGLTQEKIGSTPGSAFPVGYGVNYNSSYGGPSYENSAVYETPLVYNNQTAAYYTNTINNANIKPNSTSQTEIGLDARFLKNRLSFDAAYFISEDGPRIFSLPLSTTSGYSSALVNGIKTQKKGIELSLTGQVIKDLRGFNWSVLANWSTYKEILTDIYPGITQLPSSYFVGSSSNARFINIGERIDAYYTRTYARTADGKIINDAGGRPIINPTPQFVGNTNPDWVWGINNKFSYKDWNFSFQFDGRVGGVISDYVEQKSWAGGRIINTVQGDMGIAREQDVLGVKSWTGEGVSIANGGALKYDALGNITNFSELTFVTNTTKTFLQDYVARTYGFDGGNMMSRTFAKLREITIGYSLPHSLTKKLGIQSANVSLVGRNLLYFAERTDIDLDQYTSGGRSGLQTPTTRRFGINLNLVF